jgi:hypothetical protein
VRPKVKAIDQVEVEKNKTLNNIGMITPYLVLAFFSPGLE